jgi:hypothetical protein
MFERVQNLDEFVAAVGLEILRKQIPCAGALRGGEDEGVPVGELRGIHPMPGLPIWPRDVSTGFQRDRSSTMSRARAGSNRIFRTAFQ